MCFLADMRGPRIGLVAVAIPDTARYRFYLAPLDELNAEADQSGRIVAFVTIDHIRIIDASGFIVIGVDIAIPKSMKGGKLCCCIGEFEFRLANGHWVFVKRGGMICS
jgi:hypothetical protein